MNRKFVIVEREMFQRLEILFKTWYCTSSFTPSFSRWLLFLYLLMGLMLFHVFIHAILPGWPPSMSCLSYMLMISKYLYSVLKSAIQMVFIRLNTWNSPFDLGSKFPAKRMWQMAVSAHGKHHISQKHPRYYRPAMHQVEKYQWVNTNRWHSDWTCDGRELRGKTLFSLQWKCKVERPMEQKNKCHISPGCIMVTLLIHIITLFIAVLLII